VTQMLGLILHSGLVLYGDLALWWFDTSQCKAKVPNPAANLQEAQYPR
jgi:hypothetical protein